MSDIDAPPPPPLPNDADRLDRLEARVAELEAKLLLAETLAPEAPSASGRPGLEGAGDWLRNNPVMAVIIAIVLLVILSHILD